MAKFENKTDEELESLLAEKREELRERRFSITGAGEKSPQERRTLKKDVARILTELRGRQLQKKS